MIWLPALPFREWAHAIAARHVAETTDPYLMALRAIEWGFVDFQVAIVDTITPALAELAQRFDAFAKAWLAASIDIE